MSETERDDVCVCVMYFCVCARGRTSEVEEDKLDGASLLNNMGHSD